MMVRIRLKSMSHIFTLSDFVIGGFSNLRVGNALPDFQEMVVVSTFVLCSVADLATGLAQVRRVLKPRGKFLFVERSRSSNDDVARWQHHLTPFHRMLANGSHLDRAILTEIANAGFIVLDSEETLVPRLPKVLGNLVSGVASLPELNDM